MGEPANEVRQPDTFSGTLSRFSHEHIIHLVGVVVDAQSSGVVWLVLELAALGELRAYLRERQPHTSLQRQLLYARQLADALAYLHAQRSVESERALSTASVNSGQIFSATCIAMSPRATASSRRHDASNFPISAWRDASTAKTFIRVSRRRLQRRSRRDATRFSLHNKAAAQMATARVAQASSLLASERRLYAR